MVTSRSWWSNRESKTAVIAYLLEHGLCDPNCATYNGETPLDFAWEPENLRLLLKFGATPNESSVRKCFPEHFQNQPADMAIKMFVLGNPGAGKSTLVKSLQLKVPSSPLGSSIDSPRSQMLMKGQLVLFLMILKVKHWAV